MNFFARYLFRAAAVLLLVSATGCLPPGQGDLDEEKEPHFLEGLNASKSKDFKGAIEEFEKAIEVNPHNSKAHEQLGWLYEEKESDPAAAIFHYERYLKLRPDSHNRDAIRQRIINCKQDLAKTVYPLPITPGMQRQLDQVQDEIKRLKEENLALRAQIPSNPPAGTVNPLRVTPLPPSPVSGSNLIPQNQFTDVRPISAGRSHTVRPGETPAAIARKYGVRLDALLSANPTLEPKRMRVGQVLKIPLAER